jgi:hypothetical protein
MKRNYQAACFYFFKKGLLRFITAGTILLFFNVFVSNGQTTYTWNQTGTAAWTVATNWAPNGVPGALDVALFNNGVINTVTNVPTQTIAQLNVTGNTTVQLQAAAPSTVLTINGGTGVDLVVDAGSALNVNGANITTITLGTGATGSITGNMNFSNAAHRLDAADVNAITFNPPAFFLQGTGCTGSVFTTLGTANAIVFTSGTTLIQNAGGNPFGLPTPNSKVVFQTGSLLRVQQNALFATQGRTYADLEINFASFNQTQTGATSPVTIDNLIITRGILNMNLTGTSGVNLKGNLFVAGSGALNFNPSSIGNLTFSGTTPQTITNNGTLTFGANQAVILNTAGVTLNSDITLNNLLSFVNGVITAPNPIVLTLSNTSIVVGAPNNGYVNGKVKKIGNTTFVFPVGKPGFGYVPIAISAPAFAADAFTAEYVRASAEALGTIAAPGLDHVSRVDYWNLNRDAGTSTVDVTLNWTAGSSSNGSASYITNLFDLAVAHFNGTSWDSYYHSSPAATGNVTAGSLTWPGVTTFSPFSLGSVDFASNPLPITFNYLNGTKQNNSHNLNWKVTCTNNPSAIMSLERSADNRNFSGITTIVADALRCQQPFAYTDNAPLSGINYYRLKMTDANGKTTYSNAIAILNKDAGFEIVGVVPSLVSNNALLHVTAAQKTKMQVVVTDIAGRVVQKTAYNLIAGSNQFTVNFSNLSAGTYQITGYTEEGKSRTVRFVKQ